MGRRQGVGWKEVGSGLGVGSGWLERRREWEEVGSGLERGREWVGQGRAGRRAGQALYLSFGFGVFGEGSGI